MTDEQWLWLFVNDAVDTDEKMEHICDKCKSEITSNRCTRCNKLINTGDNFINPNFNKSKFDGLMDGTND